MRRHAALPSHVPSIAGGVLMGSAFATFIVWRLAISIWEVVQVSSQVSLLVLGCWILRQDSLVHRPSQTSLAPHKWLSNSVGAAYTIMWLCNYGRVGLFMARLPPEYEPVFQETPFAYAMFGLYTAESIYMQALLHRMLPSWACHALGALQALLFSSMTYRYNITKSLTAWRVLRTFVLPQVGMFAPYHLSRRWVQRSSHGSAVISKAPASLAVEHEAKQQASTKAAALKGPQPDAGYEFEFRPLGAAKNGSPARSVCSCDGGPAAIPCASRTHSAGECAARGNLATTAARPLLADDTSEQPPASPAWPSLLRKQEQAPKAANRSSDKLAQCRSSVRAIQQLQHPFYTSRLRAPYTACLKLDTGARCDSLPTDVAQQLQDAICTSIGHATSLRVTDVAVRPGCICITMKLDMLLTSAKHHMETAGHASVTEMANAVLPVLLRMLSQSSSRAVLQRALVQLENQLVACMWEIDKQAWDVKPVPITNGQPAAAARPWLGITTAVRLKPTVDMLAKSMETSYGGVLQVLAEVQLWGVSKVANVEGWTPPQQHDDNEAQWISSQQPSKASPALKLLARAAGGYLPTQVLRLMPGSNNGYVTAQVSVQLHEHELIRHHDGGTPSTLLLMDMELWQNEVLLSSSPMLSIAAACAQEAVAAETWWWGAADSTVAAALLELQQYAACSLSAPCFKGTAQEAQAAMHAHNAFLRDLSSWLVQVSHVACRTGFCLGGGSTDVSTVRLQQPMLPPVHLHALAEDIMQHAQHMDWQDVRSMVAQQVSNVLQPSAKCTSKPWQPCKTAAMPQGLRTALFGYACTQDEQLYKQQLAMYLRQVLLVSSGFQALIVLVWGLRTLAWDDMQFHAWLSLSWFAIHMAAVANMLLSHGCKRRSSQRLYVKRAYQCVAIVYIWRLCCHLAGTILMTSDDNMQNQAFQQPRLWIGSQLVLLMTEQVPSSVLLPASWGFVVSLLLEFPGLLIPVVRGAAWHPAVSVGVTFLLSVGARAIAGLQLRRQLRMTSSSHTSGMRSHPTHSKGE